MIVRVNWNYKDQTGEVYHVYQCTDYMVEITGYSGSTNGPSGPSNLTMYLGNNGKPVHELVLSNGAEAFVMNDDGKTIDIIRTL